MKRIATLLLSLVLLFSCASADESSWLYVEPVEGLADDFIMGMDVSSVLALEEAGVRYYDFDGTERDLFAILSDNGVNMIRVRVWNNPFDENGNGFGGGSCDIATAVEIGKRATAHNMALLVDFHYSDFWADPAKQQSPRAWQGMSVDEKADALYAYTHESLTALAEAGVNVGMVQIGNETNGKLCDETNWKNIAALMSAGSRAVREVFPEAKVALHFANPETYVNYRKYATMLKSFNVDYDVFGTSYYPYWHGTLDNLKSILTYVKDGFGKDVMVLETSYAYTLADGDFHGNTIGEAGGYEAPYPFTVQGQTNHVMNVIRAMNEIGGIGVCYWEGAWIPTGGDTWEANSAMWEKYGTGWASSYASVYDPVDAGQYFGGCACENQALFDFDGRALESLKVFRLARTGSIVPVTADALENVSLMFDLNAPVVLPETVNAIMNDDSRQAIPVEWEKTDLAAMNLNGPATYIVTGTAGGMTATCEIAMVEYNFIANYSFEEKDESMWRAENLGGTEQLYVEDKKSDSLTGSRHYHFYSAGANAVEFTLEQDVADLPAGVYRYEIGVMGGDGGETEIYAYVKINGEIAARQDTEITVWNSWATPVIENIKVAEGDQVTIGMYVRCAGKGAWGKIDDAKLNRVE